MKKFLTISIDVEPDCSSTWAYTDPLTFKGMRQGIGEILQPLFNRYGMKPTYLLNNVVMEDSDSVEFLKSLPGDFELGTHLHPEFIAPDRLYDNYAGKSARKNCCFYPPEIESGKLRAITELFRSSFGYQPTSFRAGRFSAGANTMNTLLDLGYKVDTSVTPHVRWSDSTREGVVDFSKAPEQPYFIKEGTITEVSPDKGGLLQVPVTIGMLPRNPLTVLASSMFGLRRPLNWHKRAWLRPAFSDFTDMKRLVEQYSAKYAENEHLVINMMFHNVEVLPGLSPYTLTQHAVDKYIRDLESFFEWCAIEKIEGITLSETYPLYKGRYVIDMHNHSSSGRVRNGLGALRNISES